MRQVLSLAFALAACGADLVVPGTPGGPGGGGGADLLDFTLTGDTRPPDCDRTDLYPREIFRAEVAQMAALAPRFALDLGDHMFACGSGAREQMQLYVGALAGFPAPWFMTMGNHECLEADCSGRPGDPNYAAFLEALRTVSRQERPFYAVDAETRFGLARIVVVADNVQSAEQRAWLEGTLAQADRIARYTIVARHHPVGGSRSGPAWVWPIVQRHRFALVLSAHEHAYLRTGARTVVCGLGGANSAQTGFCRVQQVESGALRFVRYDLQGDPIDAWQVPAQ